MALQEVLCGQQKTLKKENAVGARVDVDPRTTQREDFHQILLGLVNYDFDSRLKASAVCCKFPGLRTLSTDWKLGAKLHQAKRSNDSEQRARLQDKMKMELKVRKLSQKHDYLAAFDLVKNTILDPLNIQLQQVYLLYIHLFQVGSQGYLFQFLLFQYLLFSFVRLMLLLKFECYLYGMLMLL